MVYQPLKTRTARLNEHAEVVSAHYRRALANVEFYPEPDSTTLRAQIDTDYANFTKAADLVREGLSVKEIQDRVCAEARSWVKGNIPAAIARYSFYQISQEELDKRSKLSRQQIRVCKAQLASALDTIEKLSKHDGDPRTATIQRVHEEFASFERAFTVYERGFSFVEIKSLSGESIQSRVEDKTIPETIAKFAGYRLSQEETKVRAEKILKLEAAAVKAHQEATARQKERDAESLPKHLKVWHKELRQLKLAFDLYAKGLSLSSIDELTGLNASSWITDGTIPVKLAYARREWIDRDFVIPAQLNADVAYIVGAVCGSSRVFSRDKGISFRSSALEKVADVRDRFQRAFSASLVEPSPDGDGYILRMGRSALVQGLFDRLGIVDGASDFAPPFEIIKYADTCRSFVHGFLAFSKPLVDVDRHIFQVARGAQPTLLKVVAAGLYLEKIYPIVRENEGSVSLSISAEREFRALCELAPELLSEDDRNKMAQRPIAQEDPIGSYNAYRKISEVLQGAYPKGVKLNFEVVLRRAQIQCEITRDVTARLAYWRNGRKPYVAQRAEALEQMLGNLYPESKA